MKVENPFGLWKTLLLLIFTEVVFGVTTIFPGRYFEIDATEKITKNTYKICTHIHTPMFVFVKTQLDG